MIEDIPTVFFGLFVYVLARNLMLAFHVIAVEIVEHETANLNYLVLVAHLKRLYAAIQQGKADRREKLCANRYKY